MGRKVIAFWLSLAMVLSFIVVLDVIIDFTPTVKGGIIRYVNETGTGGAFTSIQDAINASNDGDTVFVYNGTYYENVVVNKTINLTGEDKDATIIDGGGSGDVVCIVTDWVNITGFTVFEGGSVFKDAGIELNNAQDCMIINNNASNSFYGIFIYYSSRNTITNNTVSNNLYGICCYSCSENNVIGNTASNNGDGIFVTSSNGNNINDNTASDNGCGISVISSSGVNVSSNNVFLNNDYGINLDSSDSNKIDSNTAQNNDYGIRLHYSDGNIITVNNISSNNWSGIYIKYSHRNIITDNTASNNDYSIELIYSTGNNITNNTLIDGGIFVFGNLLEHWNTQIIDSSNTVNSKPIYYLKNQTIGTIPTGAGQVILANCTNIKIEDQRLTNCTVGIELGFSSGNNITGNNASSNILYGIYLYKSNMNNITGNNASMNEYGFYLDSSNRNTVASNTASNNYYGLYLGSYGNNNIIENNLKNNNHGIYLEYSYENKITGNNASSNNGSGINLFRSNWVNISNNTIFLNKYYGIYLRDSSGINITNNTMVKDGIGVFGYLLVHWDSHNINTSNTVNGKPVIYWKNQKGGKVPSGAGQVILANCTKVMIENQELTYGSVGVELGFSSNNNITCNNASNNFLGICLYSSNWNEVIGNNVSNSGNGIHLVVSSNNRIDYNNIVDNLNQAYDDRSDNYWDNGYPQGGNYWSDYVGVDKFKGPNQDQPGSDGIGDTNYTIDSDSVDHYPLMEPYIHKPLENYTILKQGWNLISIPLIQATQNLTKVLEMIAGYYDSVQWYDITNINDPWKHHKVGKPYGNDLNKLNETIGFWIHITQPGDTIFIYNGTQPISNQIITLHPGWNLVGYPSLTNHNRTEGLNNLTFDTHVNAIWTYNAATQKWKEIGPSDYFELGRGYWIHAKTKCEWEVPL